MLSPHNECNLFGITYHFYYVESNDLGPIKSTKTRPVCVLTLYVVRQATGYFNPFQNAQPSIKSVVLVRLIPDFLVVLCSWHLLFELSLFCLGQYLLAGNYPSTSRDRDSGLVGFSDGALPLGN